MDRTLTNALWIVALATIVVLSVPWFLWRDSRVVAGLPAWLWWHVAWMGLAAAAFYAFARGPWDRWMGVTRRG